jgi:serine/threonine protein kinase
VIELDAQRPFAGRYRVVRRVAAGGMGAVFEVLHIETQRRRALKVMLPELVSNRELRDRFQMEARVTANVESEYIVDVFDAGVDESTGMPFLVMELLQGEELGEVLKRAGAVAPQNAIAYLRQVASALDKTHAVGIVHRDLKPENLFLTHREDGTPRVKILDFGISKVVSEASTGANATRSLGTPLYMAPEQVLGQNVSPATDLYSLGLIAYALIVGVSYWQSDTEKFENAIAFALHTTKGATESAVTRAAKVGRPLPPAFDAWFQRATHLEPAKRFRRASELVNELAALLGSADASRKTDTLFVAPNGNVQTGGPAVSGAIAVGTAPGTEFDRLGTIPGVPSKTRKTPWLIAAGVIGVAVLVGAGALRARGAVPAAELPSAASSPVVAPSHSSPAVVTPDVAPTVSGTATAVPSVATAPSTSTVAAASAAPIALRPNPTRAASGGKPTTPKARLATTTEKTAPPATPAHAHATPAYTRD